MGKIVNFAEAKLTKQEIQEKYILPTKETTEQEKPRLEDSLPPVW